MLIMMLYHLLCLLAIWPLASAQLSIYLSRREVSSLIGVSSRIYYVQDGSPRPLAISMPIPMAQGNDKAHYTWVARQGSRVSAALIVFHFQYMTFTLHFHTTCQCNIQINI